MLFVLPKWGGTAADDDPGRLASAIRLPSDEVEEILRLVVPDGRIRRLGGSPTWKSRLGVAPTLSAPQLIESRRLRPVVAGSRGLLIGEIYVGGQRIWILSDPDVLSNHGLGRGDNSVLAVAMVDALRPPGGAVIVDETIHGFHQDPDLWRAMLEFPFVVTTIVAAVAIMALLSAATGRFGAPVPVKSPHQAGKEALITNTAGLLEYGGHAREILRNYVAVTLRDAARRLRAPRHLDEAALVQWLDQVGEARGVETKYRRLRDEAEAVAATTRISSRRPANSIAGKGR